MLFRASNDVVSIADTLLSSPVGVYRHPSKLQLVDELINCDPDNLLNSYETSFRQRERKLLNTTGKVKISVHIMGREGSIQHIPFLAGRDQFRIRHPEIYDRIEWSFINNDEIRVKHHHLCFHVVEFQ